MFNKYMSEAIKMTNCCKDDIPVGAVVVHGGEIIASTCNLREKNNDITAHAEVLALAQAAKVLGNWRLNGCELYVTLEPCPMCAWTILQARINAVYFGAYDVKYGALGSAMDLREFSESKLSVYGGIMEDECNEILENFWKNRRK